MTFDFNGAAGDPLAVDDHAVFVNSLDFRIRVDFDPDCSRVAARTSQRVYRGRQDSRRCPEQENVGKTPSLKNTAKLFIAVRLQSAARRRWQWRLR